MFNSFSEINAACGIRSKSVFLLTSGDPGIQYFYACAISASHLIEVEGP